MTALQVNKSPAEEDAAASAGAAPTGPATTTTPTPAPSLPPAGDATAVVSAEDKTKITSSYRDFSRVLPEKHNDASSLIAQSTTAKEPTFPVKLHMILSNPDFQVSILVIFSFH